MARRGGAWHSVAGHGAALRGMFTFACIGCIAGTSMRGKDDDDCHDGRCAAMRGVAGTHQGCPDDHGMHCPAEMCTLSPHFAGLCCQNSRDSWGLRPQHS